MDGLQSPKSAELNRQYYAQVCSYPPARSRALLRCHRLGTALERMLKPFCQHAFPKRLSPRESRAYALVYVPAVFAGLK